MPARLQAIRHRILPPIVVAVALLLWGAITGIYRQARGRLEGGVRTHIEVARRLFCELLGGEAQSLSAQLDFLAEDRGLQEAWIARDREGLMSRAMAHFPRLRDRYRVSHFYFILPSKECFLRVHNPAKHGDLLRRHTLDGAVREGDRAGGVELGIFGTLTLREVHPWRINGEIAGFLELGMEIVHLTPRVTGTGGVELIITVDKTRLDHELWEEGRRMMGSPGQWDELRSAVVVDRSLEALPEGLPALGVREPTGERAEFFAAVSGNRRFRGSATPFIDAGGGVIGDLCLLSDTTAAEASLRRLIVVLSGGGVLIGGVLLGCFFAFLGTVQAKLMASHEQLATENAERRRAEQSLQEAHDLLEARVTARTRELSDANTALAVEIVEREQAVIETEAARMMLQRVIDLLPMGVFWKDCELRYLGGNKVFARDAGQDTPEALLGKDDFGLAWTREEAEHYREDDRQVIGSGEPKLGIEEALTTADGNRIWIRTGKVPLTDMNGDAIGVLGAYEDITKLRQAEEERSKLGAQLRQQQKLESVGTLASGVAHEINNPISGIMGYAQLIKDSLAGKDETNEEFADEILSEAERVARLVNSLLQFARHEKQSHSLARIHEIVESTLSLIRAVMQHDQITLEVDLPEDLPRIKCRSQQIQQVIMNLLTNARDALNEKYEGYDQDKVIRMTAGMTERNGAPGIRLTVEDHGPGIPEELRARIFDPFYTTKRPDRGTGLGLSISYGIVADHGGELTVESGAGTFTRFHVDLPVDNGWELGETEQ